ncbi:MAG: hypothetical protein RL701_7092 [Pseudomonadota bacterium]
MMMCRRYSWVSRIEVERVCVKRDPPLKLFPFTCTAGGLSARIEAPCSPGVHVDVNVTGNS